MGGLAVDISDIHNHLSIVVLSPRAVRLLARRGHFIDISDSEIRDKSKADLLAKGLVILQVTWMFLQSISRKAAGLPLSPLEIHTLVHAGCAMCMYALWFRKPFDVRAPTLVSTVGFENLIALLLMQSRPISTIPYGHLDLSKYYELSRPIQSEASYLMFDDTRQAESLSVLNDSHRACKRTTITEAFDDTPEEMAPTSRELCNIREVSAEPENGCIGHAERCETISEAARYSADLRCNPTSAVRIVRNLRSGDFVTSGIGISAWLTGPVRERYSDTHVRTCFPKISRPRRPPSLHEISSELKDRIPWENLSSSGQALWPAGICHWHELSVPLSEKDLERWQRAGAAFSDEILISKTRDNDSVAGDKSERDLPTPSSQCYRSFKAYSLPDPVCPRDWYRDTAYLSLRRKNLKGNMPTDFASGPMTVLWLLGSFYGGVHLALWTYNFPSRTECLLWRLSAVALGALPVLVILKGSFKYCFDVLYDLRYHSFVSHVTAWLRGTLDNVLHRAANDLIAVKTPSCLSRTLAWLQDIWIRYLGSVLYTCVKARYIEGSLIIIIWGVAAAAALLYTLARVFIVVESFISLRHVPIGVYSGVTWAQYIPHL